MKDNPEFKSNEKSKNFSIKGFLSSLIKGKSKEPDNGKQKEGEGNSGLIDSYLGRLKIMPIRGSRLVNVGFTGVNPEEIKKIVNRHANEYI